jgi:PKHD-type hydroxylase
MFRLIPLLSPDQIAELRAIAESHQFVDGRITNPHSKVKNNLQLHHGEAQARVAEVIRTALLANEDFRHSVYPKAIAPAMLSRYDPGMNYGLHADTPLMQLPRGLIRADVSCTVFLNDPDSYDGGALRIQLGSGSMTFKEPAGTAIVYPSTTLHEVEPVTRGNRLVALTFIQSFVSDPQKRDMLYELHEVTALEGLKMDFHNFTRLQAVLSNLLRRWSEGP